MQNALVEPVTENQALDILGSLIDRVSVGAGENGSRLNSSERSPIWCGSPPARKAWGMSPIGVR